ncbi:lysophospholipid acyltransferase family protein [Yoonia sediminilitoris]|uniref:KDO2-lipid IV(A) lauroyltransferase n=1 Tax=Yoonia sediminilitoris TaxID=1286148 RepID=A0A2T6KDU6_9RHOB|nr:lysophospholipid acyltransferase family protein [Yoonia sediminilitoris]PUB13178.1 KDO2-lipid IV(A) lauroyltransferase [Yoonia sediminilitoris]RCW94513.1 KDO2-lipid IV(A) lauroyltransferase [Yoonia sediminilitoris]
MADTDETPLIGTKADWLADRALRGLIGTLLRMPYQTRVPMMGAALRHAIGPLVGYRKRAEENLTLIYPDMPTHERRALAAACCDNFGRTLIENYAWEEFSERLSGVIPTGLGLDAISRATAENRPVMFVTGHFGNHEAPRQVLTAMGHNIGGLYRPMMNPYFNAHYARTMTSWGGPVFEQGRRGTMGFARHLKAGGMGTLLFDVSAKGVKIPFLGKPARTATSAADIALKLNALVIPYFGIRQPDGMSFKVEVEAPIAHDSPRNMMIEMTGRLEAQIARNPAQWFWVHRRWKGYSKST